MESSFHSLILLLPFLQLPIPKINLDCCSIFPYIPSIKPVQPKTSYNHFARTPLKTPVFCCQECVFKAPLPSSIRPTVPRLCFCGDVFADPLPSNGYTCHNSVNNDNTIEYIDLRSNAVRRFQKVNNSLKMAK
jgi:hypothetical protein